MEIELSVKSLEGEIIEIGPGLKDEILDVLKGKRVKVGDEFILDIPFGEVKVKVLSVKSIPSEAEVTVSEETRLKLVKEEETTSWLMDEFRKGKVALNKISFKEAIEVIKTARAYIRVVARKGNANMYFFATTYKVTRNTVVITPVVIVNEEKREAYKVIPRPKIMYTLHIPVNNIEIIECIKESI